ncbi:bifunctional aspartokinase/homoserine dehydrogenase 1, chloroplastic-like [Malus sylvestris]|uniref:bifunctional aspartokinase/homoserine dehydrogenase 1, chloroplastic-like n=1 Tax=Malus sylvestris TaxID=3752 RepID=UPI0021ACDDAD|nr:bifunctional aspartokinase/homoserine dehydrogenase 1, chloroplastic-like [Malus sylvestris]
MQKLPQFDQEMSKKRQTAEDAGGVLKFVGVVDMVNQKGEVKLQTYENDYPFAQLSVADNIIALTTTRYKAQPHNTWTWCCC